MTRPKVIAAIPCHNEERHIGDIVRKAAEYVDQVIVIDDGSSDTTAQVAEAVGALVIRHKVNKGKGMAMNTAFWWAKENGVQALVLLDGDGQHNPAEIPLVLKPALEGKADVVVGSRFLGVKSPIPRYRVIGLKILTVFTNLSSGVRLTDSQSGFRAFSKKAIDTLHFTRTKVGDVECEMQFLIRENHLKVTEAAIVVGYEEKAKRNPVAQGIGNLFAVFRLIAERRLLRKLTVLNKLKSRHYN
ncbi:glycosyltransferase family 2 protein [Dehalococcoidia bacterium]|nr:glycosyltransferase family 2 protein [Dehalococcoidia bacterium]